MIQDLHSHTYYSFCGRDDPRAIIEAAIAGGIELFGISDHGHGVAFGCKEAYHAPKDVIPDGYDKRALRRYFDHMDLLREKYADKIRILRGIELATDPVRAKRILVDSDDVSYFDYALVEDLDHENTITNGDIFTFAERCGCPAVGVAHTDMFSFIASIGEEPYRYFRRMAEAGIFWEMNISYDSIHKYKEHEYVLEFFKNEEQQAIVRESGVRLSVGFDGHRVEDYLPNRVRDYCGRLTGMGIKLAFEN